MIWASTVRTYSLHKFDVEWLVESSPNPVSHATRAWRSVQAVLLAFHPRRTFWINAPPDAFCNIAAE
eukprot:6166989-Amphidinium_carterae.1